MHLGFSKNEYGTEISLHKCDVCGVEFSQCPARKQNDPCQGIDCKSYDPNHDVELMLADGAELMREETKH